MSDLDATIRTLQAHEAELRARGVRRLALFGSISRGDARPDSDVDLLVDFDRGRDLSLVDYAEIRLRLCELLGRDVDLVQRGRLKPFLRDAILSEARDVL